MKSQEQRLKDLLKKRIARFLEANPTIKINPHNFCTKINACPTDSTCFLGMLLFNSSREYEDSEDSNIRIDASNILGISYNEVCRLENGFMEEDFNENVGFDEEDTYTKLGLALRKWTRENFPERTICIP